MASKLTRADRAIVRLADGTVKQQNLLTGTEVWTVPGRGNRPLTAPHTDHNPIDHEADGHHCAFCCGRYLETPPHKQRLARRRFSEVVVAAGVFSGAVDELDDCVWGRGFPYIQWDVIGVLRLQTKLLQHDHLRLSTVFALLS